MISGSISLIRNDNEPSLAETSACTQCPLVQDTQLVLISYAKRYIDIASVMRLKFIAQVCPKLRVQALELAIRNVKETYNVKLYEELYATLRTELERDCESAESTGETTNSPTCSGTKNKPHLYDAQWVMNNTLESTLLLQELETALNFKKTNSGSAYVRRILEEIGDYHVKCGNLKLAAKFYARARSYCTSSDNVINVFKNLIRVSIYMSNWWHVLNYIEEAKQYALGFPSLDRTVPAQLSCAAGLANLGLKTYKTAASCFLLTPYNGYDYEKIIAPQDVATYAAICGLATLELDKLQLECVNSVAFRPFLSQSPSIANFLTQFFSNKFEHCVQLLHEIESDIRLDAYLAPHVNALYDKIMARIGERRRNPSELLPNDSSVIVNEVMTSVKTAKTHFRRTD